METTHKEIRKKAVAFIKKYNLDKTSLTVARLRTIAESLNFGIVDYWHHMKNTPEVTALFRKIGGEELSKQVKAFLYYTNEERYIFLCADLIADDTVAVLLHELGHIYLDHLEPEGIIHDTGTQREDEALLFSLYVREICARSSQFRMFHAFSVVAAALVLISAGVFLFRYMSAEKNVTYNGQTIIQVGDTGTDAFLKPHCYWTIGGEVFHLRLDCQHIRNSSTVYVGSIEESEKEACCKTCYKEFCARYGDEAE